MTATPNNALQRSRPSRAGCHPRFPQAGSLSFSRWKLKAFPTKVFLRTQIIFGIAAGSIVASCDAAQLPQARMTVKVTDEHQNPIYDANVKVVFDRVVPNRDLQSLPVTGHTDHRGEYTATGPTAGQRIGGTADKPGYYSTSFSSPLLQPKPDGKWYPWNPRIEVILKKIERPIPLHARKVDTDLPVVNTAVGFDLIRGDWVAPHGRGESSDMVFTLTRRFNTARDYESTLKISFVSASDGIQPWDDISEYHSALKLPRLAPETGYAQPYVLSNRCLPGSDVQQDVRDNRNYFFRVRTALSSNDQAVNTLYGKIDGDIRFSPIRSKTCSLMFTYYLNPTPNDHNLEFDIHRNLDADLKDEEQVKTP